MPLLIKKAVPEARPRLRLADVARAPAPSPIPGIALGPAFVVAMGAATFWMYRTPARAPPAASPPASAGGV
jgi:hypothetical protein